MRIVIDLIGVTLVILVAGTVGLLAAASYRLFRWRQQVSGGTT